MRLLEKADGAQEKCFSIHIYIYIKKGKVLTVELDKFPTQLRVKFCLRLCRQIWYWKKKQLRRREPEISPHSLSPRKEFLSDWVWSFLKVIWTSALAVTNNNLSVMPLFCRFLFPFILQGKNMSSDFLWFSLILEGLGLFSLREMGPASSVPAA